MGVYIKVMASETGGPITNASFTYNWINYNNGEYFVFCPVNAAFFVNAPERNSLLVNSTGYWYMYAWLTKKVVSWSNHSSGVW